MQMHCEIARLFLYSQKTPAPQPPEKLDGEVQTALSLSLAQQSLATVASTYVLLSPTITSYGCKYVCVTNMCPLYMYGIRISRISYPDISWKNNVYTSTMPVYTHLLPNRIIQQSILH